MKAIMFSPGKPEKFLAVAMALIAMHTSSHAIDHISSEFSTGNKTKMLRVGAQWDWQSKWFQSNGTHLGGYNDVSAAFWHNSQHNNIPGSTQNLWDVGIRQVLRFQNDNKLGFYAELGTGPHLLSTLYNNNGRRFSTAFNFGNQIGIGYIFSNKVEVALKIQHFSNASIKQPNNGANFATIKVAYPF
jgi:lipid A 3-O-deacylase